MARLARHTTVAQELCTGTNVLLTTPRLAKTEALEAEWALAKSDCAKARLSLADRAPAVSGALHSMLLFRGCGHEDLRFLPPVPFDCRL